MSFCTYCFICFAKGIGYFLNRRPRHYVCVTNASVNLMYTKCNIYRHFKAQMNMDELLVDSELYYCLQFEICYRLSVVFIFLLGRIYYSVSSLVRFKFISHDLKDFYVSNIFSCYLTKVSCWNYTRVYDRFPYHNSKGSLVFAKSKYRFMELPLCFTLYKNMIVIAYFPTICCINHFKVVH